MPAIITDQFRRNNATLFYNDIVTRAEDSPLTYNSYYIGLGKSDPWADDADPPSPTNSALERQDVLDNIIVIKEIVRNNVSRLIPRTNQIWQTGRVYKRYDPTDPSCFEKTGDNYACYAISGTPTLDLYLCLANDSNTVSEFDPASLSSELEDGDAGQLDDDYVWVKIGELPTGDLDFIDSTTFLKLPSDQTSQVSPTATGTAGLIFGFKVVNGGSGYTSSAEIAATVRGETLAGANATTRTVYFQTNGSGVVTAVTDGSGNPITYSTTTGWGDFRKVSVDFTSAPSQGSGAKVIPLVAPANGFAYDNFEVFPPYYIGVAADFEQSEAGDALTAIKFRQVSIIRDITGRTDNDSPDDTVDVLDSLNSLTMAATVPLSPDSGWYFIDSNDNKAWIDQIDGTKIYYHQNSELGSTRGVIASNGDIEIYDESDQSQGTYTISAKNSPFGPEHLNDKGEVIFLENRIPITRNSAQTEKVRIILQF